LQAPFADNFITPNPRWLDWRNKQDWGGTVSDPLVEWGNRQRGFNEEMYKGIRKFNRDGIQGRLTNQIGYTRSGAYFLTFCQFVYFPKNGSFAHDSNCGYPGHLASYTK